MLVIAGLLLAACGAAATPEATQAPTPAPPATVTNTPAPVATTAPTATEPPAQAAAPDASLQWDAPPEMTIDPDQIYLATFKTERGDIKIELFASKAPKTVNNLIFLAKAGFYDGTTFHRVLPDFMAQGGDPTGTGGGGPGYRFEDELDPSLTFDGPGYLAMANAGPNTNGSQFFITTAATPWLNGRHTIFGKVVEGLDVLYALTLRDPQNNPDFDGDVLETVVIEETAVSLLPPPTATPVPIVPVPEEGRPLAELDIPDREDIYTGPPEMIIDPAKSYVATIETTQGDITVELYTEDAPESVNNFVVLAQLGYWDSFPIVFTAPDQFVLTGSPAAQPSSDVGYSIPAEYARPNITGAVGYFFRTDRIGSSASQFYFLLADVPDLDGQWAVFGGITEGLDVAQALTTDDAIETISIEEE
ncbi:MAG: peptidylprolyl isomerase [Anaerolineae bacterium]